MKLYEYRTDGKRVLWRETASTVVLWRDAVSTGTSMSMTAKAAAILTEGWRTMTPAEVNAWCFGAKAIPPGISADDWQGMYHVAAKRAQDWEDKAKALQVELDKLKGDDQMSIDREQLTRLPPEPIDWQTRAVEAVRLAAELKSAVAHAQGDLFAAQLRVAALETEAGKATAELQWLRGVVETHEETLARVREVAERQAALSVSNGSWQQASRDCGNKILRALEGGK